MTLSETLGIKRLDPDYYALQLGNTVLGGSFYSSRFYRDLRLKNGLVYYVGAELQAGKTRASYDVEYACDPANVAKARAIIDRDLHQMATADVSDEELRSAKTQVLRDLPLAEEASIPSSGASWRVRSPICRSTPDHKGEGDRVDHRTASSRGVRQVDRSGAFRSSERRSGEVAPCRQAFRWSRSPGVRSSSRCTTSRRARSTRGAKCASPSATSRRRSTCVRARNHSSRPRSSKREPPNASASTRARSRSSRHRTTASRSTLRPFAEFWRRSGSTNRRCAAASTLQASKPATTALAASGAEPGAIHNNCSGKHAGILALCVHLGLDTASYLKAAHPAQRLILEFCGRMTGDEPENFLLGVDGCGIPVFATSLRRAAHAYARFATLEDVSAADARALRTVRDAMTAAPLYAGGTARFDSALIAATQGRIVGKGGAEGVHGDALLGEGLGLALKVIDESRRGAPGHARAARRVARLLTRRDRGARAFRTAGGTERGRAGGRICPAPHP